MAEVNANYSAQNRATQRALQQEEEELRAKMNQIRRQYDDATKEYERRTQEIKDLTAKDVEVELTKREMTVGQEQQKGYEALLQMRRQYQNALRNTSTTGEKDLRELRQKQEVERFLTETQGAKQIEEQRRKTNTEKEFAAAQAEMEISQLKSQGQMQKEIQMGEHEALMNELRRRSEMELGQARENFQQAKESTLENYAVTHQKILDQYHKILQDTQARANSNLKGTQESYARKLGTYEDRMNDPFYQMVQVPASLSESEDAVELRAVIPKHEQNSVQVSVKGNKVVLSGTRRSEETQKNPETGEINRTSGYQSYSHEFPLSTPVSSSEMTRQWNGDVLVARFPKKGTFQPYQPKQAPVRMTQEKPLFPPNLEAAIPPEKIFTPTEEQTKSADERRVAAIEGGPIAEVANKPKNTPLQNG